MENVENPFQVTGHFVLLIASTLNRGPCFGFCIDHAWDWDALSYERRVIVMTETIHVFLRLKGARRLITLGNNPYLLKTMICRLGQRSWKGFHNTHNQTNGSRLPPSKIQTTGVLEKR